MTSSTDLPAHEYSKSARSSLRQDSASLENPYSCLYAVLLRRLTGTQTTRCFMHSLDTFQSVDQQPSSLPCLAIFCTTHMTSQWNASIVTSLPILLLLKGCLWKGPAAVTWLLL